MRGQAKKTPNEELARIIGERHARLITDREEAIKIRYSMARKSEYVKREEEALEFEISSLDEQLQHARSLIPNGPPSTAPSSEGTPQPKPSAVDALIQLFEWTHSTNIGRQPCGLNAFALKMHNIACILSLEGEKENQHLYIT